MGYTTAFHETSVSVVAGTCGKVGGIAVNLNCEFLLLEDKINSGVPRNFVRWGGGSTNSVEDRGQREWGSWAGSPLVRDSGSSCNLAQEISIHIVTFS